jgi:hypothetical protein
MSLPPAPPSLPGDDGAPRTGLFAGAVVDASFERLRHPFAPGILERKLMEKRWTYVFVSTPEMMAAFAIVDAGYLSSGICAVFDRGSRRLLANENPVLPPLCANVSDSTAQGLSARLIGPGIDARLQRNGDRISLRARWAHVEADLELDASRAPSPITAIAPVGVPGRFDLTQKTVLLPAEGVVRAGNIDFPVEHQLAGIDYTHGYLARETSWKWGFAVGGQTGTRVAFNFSEGFLQGDGENVAWIDGEPRPTGAVRFHREGVEPLSRWTLRSDSGEVDLVFRPEGYRAQTIDLKLILSKYLQPFGTYAGKLFGIDLADLPGVAEDHSARW